ncbi:MAG: hypothetical protein HONBIEJF_01138 [Fimbriimonadaceae bacterium]|nr:hypothetical protein [Fimbriimonadaceae bacterium]
MIIVIIILGVLLILGTAFAAIIARNIQFAGRGAKRTVAGDLAEAGTRYCHSQLLNSELGADWRPDPTAVAVDAQGYTKDPDALYLRAGTNFGMLSDADPVKDLGGPDGFGPFTRMSFDRGRSLVRVRYTPFDLAGGENRLGSNLRERGKARNYLVIETIGRAGELRTDRPDPTQMLSRAAKVTNFANSNEFRSELGQLRELDASNNVDGKKQIAFASIGIIETARFITAKDRRSRAAELGVPGGLGVMFEGKAIDIAMRWGGAIPGGSGSLYCNTDLVVHGEHDVLLNPTIGDGWFVAGEMKGANNSSALWVTRPGDPAANELRNNGGVGSLNSDSERFTTLHGVIRDGVASTDGEGFARAVGRKEPPLITTIDPATRLNRYQRMSRDSGVLVNGRNTGRYGYGRNVYLDTSERANLPSDEEREIDGAIKSLPDDWLNPSNSRTGAWQGPFYRPLATHIQLVADGFVITRDSRSRNRYWRNADGSATTHSRVKFRIRRVLADGKVYIINSIQHPDLIGLDASSVSDQDFQTRGLPFYGVLFCEGDLRVRGVIPTNLQLSIVSLGSIYVEGSITKGVVRENGQMLGPNEQSTSMLMMMAKDYVAVNTTAFFAPGPGEDPQAGNQDALPNTPNPVALTTENPELVLRGQLLLDPDTPGALGPSDWQPYALRYTAFGSNIRVPSMLMVSQSADNGGPAFVGVDVAAQSYPGTADLPAPYLFARALDFATAGTVIHNAAQGYFVNGVNVPIYGLGTPGINAYPRFETIAHRLVDPGAWSYSANGHRMTRTNAIENDTPNPFALAMQDETLFRVRQQNVGNQQTQNYYLARAAVAPSDVRIECAMYAEEGSFFVIPGPWFNFNTNDTRPSDGSGTYFPRFGAQSDRDQFRRQRFEQYGNTPDVPFFGEPLDVRITVVGAVSENMPPAIAQQGEWMKRWGWIPRFAGASERQIPEQHVPRSLTNPNQFDPRYMDDTRPYAPNLIISYDPQLALATDSFGNMIRRNGIWALPPMPRLPVSPTLAYFGEVNP